MRYIFTTTLNYKRTIIVGYGILRIGTIVVDRNGVVGIRCDYMATIDGMIVVRLFLTIDEQRPKDYRSLLAQMIVVYDGTVGM